MNILNIFKKKKKKQEQKPAKKSMEAENLEDFKDMYLTFHKQEIALAYGFSYFDVTTSNADGTILGEKMDNACRVQFLHENNKQFLEQIDEEMLMRQAREEVESDMEKYKEDNQD